MPHSVETPSRILVIQTARIGDTLLVTPTVRLLKEAYPQAHLTFMGHPDRVALLEHLPFVDRLQAFRPKLAPLLGHLAGVRWDLALVYGHHAPTLRYALRRAKRVIAFRQPDDSLNARLQPAVAEPAEPLHAVEERLLLSQPLGLRAENLKLAYQVSPDEARQAQQWLESTAGPNLPRPLVGLQLRSFPTKAYRDWPLDHFMTLAHRLLGAYPQAGLVILGGAESRETARIFQARFPGRCLVAAGNFSLRQSAALMARLDLYIGVDTGPSHLAGALGIPMVVLYHCRFPGHLLCPRQHDNLSVVEHPARQGSCSEKTSMAEIAADRVWSEVEHRLAPFSHSRP
ncbi:MAG: glycosyltransferase family 9 protein [Magnetococcales bacterium]|nr:glycosyltransferase family 9 protein [Magnetococcales bacterium]